MSAEEKKPRLFRKFLRPLGMWLALIVFSGALVLVSSEVLSRIFYSQFVPKWIHSHYENFIHQKLVGTAYYWAYRAHPYSVFEPHPNYKLPDGEKAHTWDTFRFPEMSVENKNESYRIALLGGSTTYENDVPLLYTYGAYLEEYLNGSFPQEQIEILNAGVGGYNSGDSFARFHYKVLDYAPDMVIINHAINDVWPRAFSKDFQNDFRNSRKLMVDLPSPDPKLLERLKKSYLLRILYFKFALKGDIPNIMQQTYHLSGTGEFYKNFKNSTPDAFRRNIEDIVHIAKARGIIPVLVTMPIEESYVTPDPEKDPYYVQVLGVREHNQIAREIASKENVLLIDLAQEMPKGKTYFGDICHTNRIGGQVKAKIVGNHVKTILKRELELQPTDYPFEIDPKKPVRPAILKRK